MDILRKKIIDDQNESNSLQEFSEYDSEIYDFLDSSLEKENSDGFSPGFSKNIIRKIEAKQQRRFNIKIYFTLSVLALISIPVLASLFPAGLFSSIILMFLKYKFAIAFVIISVILIQFCEKLTGFRKDIH